MMTECVVKVTAEDALTATFSEQFTTIGVLSGDTVIKGKTADKVALVTISF